MKMLRKLLFPFAIIYDAVTRLRNIFFDTSLLKSKAYDFPVIAVGNLSVGGTGKSPMVEYLIGLIGGGYKTATLSRGYRRKSQGFVLATQDSTAELLGDEPLQFYTKFKKSCTVAVHENRQEGIAKLQTIAQPEVILLDDAYQHRKVEAGLYILLTKYNDLYTDDWILPMGNLRESKTGAKRAQVIVVTKCPDTITAADRARVIEKIKPRNKQQVFFSSVAYDELLRSNTDTIPLTMLKEEFCLVTGIANPDPLCKYLSSKGLLFNHKKYKDHHNFSEQEIASLAKEEMIVTTEKDFMRLQGRLKNLYYLPIHVKFLEQQSVFDKTILNYIDQTLNG